MSSVNPTSAPTPQDVLSILKSYLDASTVRIAALEQENEALRGEATRERERGIAAAISHSAEIERLHSRIVELEKDCEVLRQENDYLGEMRVQFTELDSGYEDNQSTYQPAANSTGFRTERSTSPTSEGASALPKSNSSGSSAIAGLSPGPPPKSAEWNQWIERTKYSSTDGEPLKSRQSLAKFKSAIWNFPAEQGLHDLQKVDNAFNRCRVFLKNLARDSKRPMRSELHPICSASENLFEYLAQDATTQSFLPDVFFLPGRVMTTSDMNMLAFGPSSIYDRKDGCWRAGSDLRELQESQHEVFIEKGNALTKNIFYMGTFQFHDLSALYTQKVMTPHTIAESVLIDAALGVPRPSGWQDLIRNKFTQGFISVDVMGLHCVGFNRTLYDALCARAGVDPDAKPVRTRKPKREGKGKQVEEECTSPVILFSSRDDHRHDDASPDSPPLVFTHLGACSWHSPSTTGQRGLGPVEARLKRLHAGAAVVTIAYPSQLAAYPEGNAGAIRRCCTLRDGAMLSGEVALGYVDVYLDQVEARARISARWV
uniref:Uncharacterized protein n=1 Tax=Mycena chlorophos TaxID=658473 RepID=A0ABQ0LH76_MYCCL|nr:predicted protein [Mycena chlorophos]